MAASILAPGRLEFTDAIDASVKRNVVLPDDYYGKLIGTAKSRAFSVAGLHDTAQLQVIFDSLNESIKNGEGFLDWKQKISAAGIKLPDYRLETIFRTNVQSAYAAGQWRQVTENNPDRYLMYDAINDARTRPSHRAWDSIILKASDPFWSIHAPPNGYNCRCTLIALSNNEAVKRGITSKDKLFGLPKPDPGWDFNPGLGGEEDLDQAKIIALMKRPEIARPILTKVEERAINATRTLEEYQALGKTIADELVNIDQLDDPAHLDEAFAAFKKRLNEAVGSIDIAIQGAPISSTLVRAAGKAYPAPWIDASNEFSVPLRTANENGRGGFARKEGYDLVMVRDYPNAVHELAHRLQYVMPDLDDYFQALHVKRTEGDPLKPLRKLDKRYKVNEKTREDEYANPYMGKEYPNTPTRAGALELMPMTMEYLFFTPRTFGWIANDEELFALALGLLFHYVP